MKKITTLLVLSLFMYELNAQISGALKIGGSGYQGDLHCRSDRSIGPFDDVNLTFGLGARLALSQTVGLRADATYIRLSGDERQFDNAGHAARGWKMKNDFLEVVASLDWEMLGHKRFDENGAFKRVLTPVIFAGAGVAFSNPEVDFNNANNAKIERDKIDGNSAQFVLPIGLGLKYYLSEGFALALEGGVRMPVSDYYDGVSVAGNEEKNDLYGFGGLTASFLLSNKKDTDGDGITDKKDACPDVPGLADFDGCPDTDGDGITDAEDGCPKLAGQGFLGGCPDTDGDGIEDKNDECPNIAGLAATKGCPDADGDGVTDAEDKCPKTPGGKETMGCPDSDGDGIVDNIDECPQVAGIPGKKGCPFVDSDKDGLEDSEDDCPTVVGTLAAKGCPDADGDGVADGTDKCPNLAGKTPDGCPTVQTIAPTTTDAPTFSDKGVSETTPVEYANTNRETGTVAAPIPNVNSIDNTVIAAKLMEAAHQIQFSTGNPAVTTASREHLDGIAFIMKNYPDQSFKIIGYTDAVGDAGANQQLSEKRAKAAVDYLVTKGIHPDRIRYVGMGEANPIATNSTAFGRKQNRRIEVIFDDGKTPIVPMGYTDAASGDCSCNGTNHLIFNLPISKKAKPLTKLGTNPEFGNSHSLDATGFYNKLKNAHRNNATDRQFLDDVFIAMGYTGFDDASANMFSEVVIPNGTTGNLGYSANHKTLYATLNAKLDRDLKAFRIRAANGCDLHFMKTCGNHFYFCTK